MKNSKNDTFFTWPKLRWKWLVAWLILQPIAAAPAVMMVFKIGPFAPPFVANGPVYMPAHLLAVLAAMLFFKGIGLLDPSQRH
jgi:hypothetical protein